MALSKIYNGGTGKPYGIVYENTLKIAEDIAHSFNEETAYEYVVACAQYAIYGECFSDNPIVQLGVNSIAPSLDKYNNNFNQKHEDKRINLELDTIAKLIREGYMYKDIGKMLNEPVKEDAIKYRVSLIKSQYPDISLDDTSGTSGNFFATSSPVAHVFAGGTKGDQVALSGRSVDSKE